MRTLLVLLLIGGSLHGGEWSFRLKDAHFHPRQAMFERNAEAAWEHVDRETRQDAGILARQIPCNRDGKPELKIYLRPPFYLRLRP